MRILVTGANGTVGSYADDVFDGHDLTLTDRDTLDVTDRQTCQAALRNVVVRGGMPYPLDVVIHLAAATDVDACELDPDLAYRTNAIGTQNVAESCRLSETKMVYVSTAGVFGGDDERGPFTEFDPPCPANVYGQSKLAGEQLAREQTRDLYIVRAGWMFGGDPLTDPKFVGKVMRQFDSGARVRAVRDKYGSPTYARDLLAGIRRMVEDDWPYGIYHMANQGTTTRLEMAWEIQVLLGLPALVDQCNSDEFPLPAPRADSEAMLSYKAQLLGLPILRPWQEALAEHLGTAVRAAA